jgi:putative flippase GtrA
MLRSALRRPALRQFLTFGLIGTGGFVVDSVMLYVCLAAGLGLYSGRIASYLVAATFTWWMNRRFTFREHADPRVAHEWLRFLAANSLGGLLNYATYALLVSTYRSVAEMPVLAVAAGSIAGLSANFVMSRYLVFRARGGTPEG